MPCNVFIYGSCVSRDIFNLDKVGYFNIVDYYARHSIGSMASKPYRTDCSLAEISSDFRRRMDLRDFDKSVLQSEYAFANSDIILMDLIDERFDLVVVPSGEIICILRWVPRKGCTGRISMGYGLLLYWRWFFFILIHLGCPVGLLVLIYFLLYQDS